jgi:phage tail sheath gpL-like
MPISFERIPANIRVPLFYVEISARAAAYFAQNQVALLIGPMLSTGIATPLTPVLVTGFQDAVGLFGAGSILSDMVDVYRRNDSYGELWCIPHLDDPTAVQATATVTWAGPATAAGSIYGYINGDRYVTNVPNGATAAEIVQLISDQLNADPFAPLTAAPGGGVPGPGTADIVYTAKHGGTIGNEIDIDVNLRGVAAGEVLPPGVSIVAGANPSGGVGVPPLADVIAAMGDDEYDFIGSPYHDAASLDLFDELMNDVTGRWAWDRQVYGGVFTSRRDTLQGLVDFGRLRNGPHVHVLGVPGNPTPPWRRSAALTAQAAVALRIDPARPLQTLPLVGVLGPPRGQGFRIADRNTLLYSGISLDMTDLSGQVRIQRCISTYQRNVWGQPDPSWLDVQTSYTLMYIVRFLRQRLLTKFPRHKLADDGTPFGPGQAVATPSIIRGELVAAYSELITMGLVENMDLFKANLIVERNANDPNRVDILFPPDLINQLRIMAMLVEFRLQYPAPVVGAAA